MDQSQPSKPTHNIIDLRVGFRTIQRFNTAEDALSRNFVLRVEMQNVVQHAPDTASGRLLATFIDQKMAHTDAELAIV